MTFQGFLMNYAVEIRLGVFMFLLMGFTFLENSFPRRNVSFEKLFRWINNLAMSLVNSLALKLFFPMLAFGIALFAQEQGLGLFNNLEWPFFIKVIVSLLLLDVLIYGQHIVFHKVPWLWRLHRVHHSDIALEASTGIRFHFVEIILSMIIKIAVVLLLGVPAIAVLVFELVLNAGSLFNHSNLRLPLRVDKYLRLFIVTPDMHRVHHSIYREETDSNYGFNLSCWDRLFRTYTAQPKDGHEKMLIGIEAFRSKQDSWFFNLFIQPFKKPV